MVACPRLLLLKVNIKVYSVFSSVYPVCFKRFLQEIPFDLLSGWSLKALMWLVTSIPEHSPPLPLLEDIHVGTTPILICSLADSGVAVLVVIIIIL